MKNLKKYLEENLKDEGKELLEHLDLESLEAKVNEEINNIVAKNKPDTDKLKQETVKELLESAGVEGASVEDLKKHIESLSPEDYKKQLEETRAQLEKLAEEKKGIENEFNKKKQMDAIRELGVTDEDKIDFIHYKVGQRVEDDKPFADALKEYQEEKPDYFKDKSSSTHRRFPHQEESEASERDIILQRRQKK